MANRVRQRSSGVFSATISKIVTLSITIGTATILIASMVLLGFQKEITKKITTFVGDFEITKYSVEASSTSLQGGQISRLMANLPSAIEKITPFTQMLMLAHTKVGVEGIWCKGIDPMVDHTALEAYLVVGRLPDLTKSTYQNEWCISHHLAQRLSIALGDSVVVHTVHPTVRYRKLKIVGIYCTYLTDIDENLAFCDMRLMQRLNNWSSETVNGYTIFLKDHVTPTKTLRDTILDLIDYDLRLIPTQRKYINFYDWLAIIEKNTTIFILFILLVAGCTMVATLIVQLMERSYMVALLKVLGAYDGQVYAILLYNSLRTLCRGLLYGNILGLGLSFLQAHYRCITLEPALYYMCYVPIYTHWKAILFPNLLIFSTLSVALYFAIKWLRQKKIIEALQEG
ncbi:ABC transporter permease [Candidatus Cardinium hertigii]